MLVCSVSVVNMWLFWPMGTRLKIEYDLYMTHPCSIYKSEWVRVNNLTSVVSELKISTYIIYLDWLHVYEVLQVIKWLNDVPHVRVHVISYNLIYGPIPSEIQCAAASLLLPAVQLWCFLTLFIHLYPNKFWNSLKGIWLHYIRILNFHGGIAWWSCRFWWCQLAFEPSRTNSARKHTPKKKWVEQWRNNYCNWSWYT